ncbi:hypothetical protein I7I50_02065 [Histoplasma capsulatum G186AR]|uniref:Uncharacterized protein n=1 Tax=Ajellomyces capsulatus TaxID=5037 RepID=A0A8H7YCH5_AJECA|nr:hypothetical protein I7I52_12279 [Histoplasma capsulatum]QSS71287.1 hypothetical protein I7I50_02065 [Histoplasma capsulatum G186AR]
MDSFPSARHRHITSARNVGKKGHKREQTNSGICKSIKENAQYMKYQQTWDFSARHAPCNTTWVLNAVG